MVPSVKIKITISITIFRKLEVRNFTLLVLNRISTTLELHTDQGIVLLDQSEFEEWTSADDEFNDTFIEN